jgi:ABC-type Na+ efflux pump permease subunit
MKGSFKMKKGSSKVIATIMILVLVVSGILTLTSCSSKQQKSKELSVKEINEKIKSTVDLSGLKEGDSEKLNKLYGINQDEVEDFVLYTAASNIKADEILILKVKDEKNIDSIKGKITARVKSQDEVFKDYLPEEAYLVENNVLKVKGNVILFVISKDAEKIGELF